MQNKKEMNKMSYNRQTSPDQNPRFVNLAPCLGEAEITGLPELPSLVQRFSSNIICPGAKLLWARCSHKVTSTCSDGRKVRKIVEHTSAGNATESKLTLAVIGYSQARILCFRIIAIRAPHSSLKRNQTSTLSPLLAIEPLATYMASKHDNSSQ